MDSIYDRNPGVSILLSTRLPTLLSIRLSFKRDSPLLLLKEFWFIRLPDSCLGGFVLPPFNVLYSLLIELSVLLSNSIYRSPNLLVKDTYGEKSFFLDVLLGFIIWVSSNG